MLIADDEPHIRRLVAGIVRALDGEVVAEAGDGEQAVELARSTRPDVVILDINMPKATGEQALARIAALMPSVIPVMMTAQDTIEVVRNCIGLGARDYILKSNGADEIYRLLGAAWPYYMQEVAQMEAARC